MRPTTSRSTNSIAAGSAAALRARVRAQRHAYADRRRRSSLRRHRQRRRCSTPKRASGRRHQPARRSEKARSACTRRRPGGRSTDCACYGGLRGDYYDFDVHGAHGRRRRRLGERQRRVAEACRRVSHESDHIELYGNWGRGFHSNDARGVVNTSTPVTGTEQRQRRGARCALRARHVQVSRPTYWWLDLDSELKFVGDSNSVEPGCGDARARLRTRRVLASAVVDRARCSVDRQPCALCQQPRRQLCRRRSRECRRAWRVAGADVWEASLRVRYLGEYPLHRRQLDARRRRNRREHARRVETRALHACTPRC